MSNIYNNDSYEVFVGVHKTFTEAGNVLEEFPIYQVRNIITGVNEYKDFNLLTCMQYADQMHKEIARFVAEKSKDDLIIEH